MKNHSHIQLALRVCGISFVLMSASCSGVSVTIGGLGKPAPAIATSPPASVIPHGPSSPPPTTDFPAATIGGPPATDGPPSTDIPPGPGGGEAIYESKSFVFESSYIQNALWLATSNQSGKNVFFVELDKANNYPMKKWTLKGATNGGSRTYVSEVGLFVARTGGKIYRVERDMNQDTEIDPSIDLTAEASASTRVCMTSFVKNYKSYLGFAWNKANNQRIFTTVPIDTTLPGKLDLTQRVDTANYGSGLWGYSCFTDQSRKLFYTAWGGSVIAGVNLETMESISASAAPNTTHTNDWTGYRQPLAGSNNGSYAIAGDSKGNILTGSAYTSANDPISDTVLGSNQSQNLSLVDGKCFYSDAACANKAFAVSTAGFGVVGPMSPLSDGRIVGLVRSSPSRALVMSLVDKTDLSKGMTIETVAEVPGDTYMYTDFTGSTLFPKVDTPLVINFNDYTKFDAARILKDLSYKWQSTNGVGATWQGLRLMGRCFKGAQAAAGQAFEVEAAVVNSGDAGTLSFPSCKNALVDHLEIKLQSLNSSLFSRTTTIEIGINQ